MITPDELFQGLLGKPVKPWPFQIRTSEALRGNNNVILRAPTGTGKTWAALLGCLHGWISNNAPVDKIIYALPLRSLASSLYISTINAVQTALNSTLLGEFERDRLSKLRITIQTGEQREDPFFLGQICFTTIDQLFSGYLNIPVSLPGKLANINTGSLVGTLVVIDEIHLLESAHSLRTLLEIGSQMYGVTQFLLMTATLSDSSLSWLKDYFSASYVEISSEELMMMPALKDKQRIYHLVEEPINIETILKHHNKGRTIVICNTVEKAQKLYQEIKEFDSKLQPKHLILLHSRFFTEDRKIKERFLDSFFGPKAKNKDVILISTQVVEAGLDLSADVLHTELCPANALLQRAGRSARYENRNKGEVFVYARSDNVSNFDYGPYKSSAPLVDLTGQVLQRWTGQSINLEMEKELINIVHTPYEQKAFADINGNRYLTRDQVLKTVRDGDRSQYSDLIRDIDSVSIFIHDQPEQLDILGGMEFLSVPRTAIFHLKDHFATLEVGKWVAKVPILPEGEKNLEISWQEVTSVQKAFNSWLLVIHPNFAFYTPELGFRWNMQGDSLRPVYHPKSRLEYANYRLETFQEHVDKTIRALKARNDDVVNARKRLAEKFSFKPHFIEEIEKLICVLHDTGKLRELYQRGSRNWEIDKYPDKLNAIGREPLAHTTFNPLTDWKDNKQKRYSRGNHAAEGALAVFEDLAQYLFESLGEEQGSLLACLLVSVIARHHSPWVKSVTSGPCVDGSEQLLNSLLKQYEIKPFIKTFLDVKTESDAAEFAAVLFDPIKVKRQKWLPLYFYLVRRLRIADQESFSFNGEFTD